MPELRCLIVDDEAPARDELRHLLAELPGMRVLGAAATADEAEILIGGVDYDIVFLDIHMPGMSGLELAGRIGHLARPPAVVFTTAYPDHAVDAFELSAVDYLLKPFDSARLQDSIDRVISRGVDRSGDRVVGDASGPMTAPTQGPPNRVEAQQSGARPERIPVQRHDRTIFVDADDIFFAMAARGYSYLKLDDTRVLVNFTLTELEDRLGDRFVRCHRSYLVNLERIVEVRPDFKGGLLLRLGDTMGSTLPVSRRQAGQFRGRLGL